LFLFSTFQPSHFHLTVFQSSSPVVRNAKSNFFVFLLKSARNCPPSKSKKASKFCLYRQVSKSSGSGQFVKDFSTNQVTLFPFFATAPNDRGYGHGRFAGEFPVVKRQKEMRAQNLLSANQPACDHRRVLGANSLFFINLFFLFVQSLNLSKRLRVNKLILRYCLF
jgi:hypothetical protein